ncbi:MAG: 23S rRNA (adenine(2503)-C(2))-methyltransferase RlmN [Patescibacteria group bacterium]|nr:23S rRNA (adenine(2503)-C(2))-methyltransferase RlmN [Patescibacteria group bacterium]
MKNKEFAAWLEQRKEPGYRLGQFKRAFFQDLVLDWDGLTTYPKALREAAAEEFTWDELKVTDERTDPSDGTYKVLFACSDGSAVEAVLMRHETGRNTVCVSSQVGCPMGCAFCATGKLGLKRNLTADEIVEQVLHMARILKKDDAYVTNVVYMGMGEPFNNYDAVMESIRTLNDPDGFGLGARHMTVSTCGIVPGILKFAGESLQVNLAISLHAPTDEMRDRIMPVNKAYPLDKLMYAVGEYAVKTNRKVLFEYLLLKGVNDSLDCAEGLADLMEQNKRLYQVNLIKYHSTGGYQATEMDDRQEFMDLLKRRGIKVTFRVSFGEEIDAACGQLAARNGRV